MEVKYKKLIKATIYGSLAGFGSAKLVIEGNVIWLLFLLPLFFHVRYEIIQQRKMRKKIVEFKKRYNIEKN